jgi:predicted RNA binding protein YcfA (HicA-like mRNA interferase family)
MPEHKITPVHYETLIKIFELDGFAVKREKGDHIIMTKAGAKRPLVIKPAQDLSL